MYISILILVLLVSQLFCFVNEEYAITTALASAVLFAIALDFMLGFRSVKLLHVALAIVVLVTSVYKDYSFLYCTGAFIAVAFATLVIGRLQ